MALEDRSSPASAPYPQQTEPATPDRNMSPKLKADVNESDVNRNKTFTSYSIDRFVNDERKEEFSRAEENPAPNPRIKFSVDQILKPDFGVKCDPLKRIVTPIIRANDEIRNPRMVLNRRSFEGARVSNGEQSAPCRRHSEEPVVAEESGTSPSVSSDGELTGAGVKTDSWPAWVYCTRYSDRPSSGPRSRRSKQKEKKPDEKRPRTAFSGDQLARLKHEFNENRYLNERRRQDLSKELNLNEAQIKIWFQNKRAKMKKSKAEKNPLALQLMAQGLYNHTTVSLDEDEYLEEMAYANKVKDT